MAPHMGLNLALVYLFTTLFCIVSIFASSQTETKFTKLEVDHLLIELGKNLDKNAHIPNSLPMPIYGGFWMVFKFGSRDTTGDIDGVAETLDYEIDARYRAFTREVVNVAIDDLSVAPRMTMAQKSQWFNFACMATGPRPTSGPVFKKYGNKLTLLEPDWIIALADKLDLDKQFSEKTKLDALALYSEVMATEGLHSTFQMIKDKVITQWRQFHNPKSYLNQIEERLNEIHGMYLHAWILDSKRIQWIANQEYLLKDVTTAGIKTSKNRVAWMHKGVPVSAMNHQTGMMEFVISNFKGSKRSRISAYFRSKPRFITSRSNLEILVDQNKRVLLNRHGRFYVRRKEGRDRQNFTDFSSGSSVSVSAKTVESQGS